jgi:tetratricopeptide (TPR) repeat protein
LDFDLGHDEAAEHWFAEAVRLGQRSGARSVEGIFLGYRGWAQQRIGNPERAKELYSAAVDITKELGLDRFSAQFEALRATLADDDRSLERQEVAFRRAIAKLRATGDTERADGLVVLQVLFEVDRARRASTALEAHRRLITAYGQLRRAPTSTDDARIAARYAQEAFDSALAQEASPSAVLTVCPGALGGLGPQGAFSLARHPTLQHMLWALVEAWGDRRSVSDEELIAATWAGERLVPSAATRRLQVGISSLRKTALGELLRRTEGGYELIADTVALMPEDQLSPIE